MDGLWKTHKYSRPASAGLFSCLHFVDLNKMVSVSRFAAALLFCTLSAPVVHRNAERLTGAFLCETGAYEKGRHPPHAGEVAAITKHNLTRTLCCVIIPAESCVPGRKE